MSVQPIWDPYTQQYIDPLTGQPIYGTPGGLPPQSPQIPEAAVTPQQQAQLLPSDTPARAMSQGTPQQAPSAMSQQSLLTYSSMMPQGGPNSGMSDGEAAATGAASGAMAGMAGGPWGMAAGAVIGGVSGAVGNSGKSRAERDQERILHFQAKRAARDLHYSMREDEIRGATALAKTALAPFLGVF